MGIPSFYRDLCRRFPTLIQRGAASKTAWLCLDFNCAMYHVLRLQPPFPCSIPIETAAVAKWESELCDAIASYMSEIVRIAAPTAGVYVGCDGVVCAAKRRQQRLRRFKGPWIAAREAALCPGARPKGEGWDQNALTPGSAFMTQLGAVLIASAARLSAQLGIPVEVSTTAEPGEGEHKLMARMRRLSAVSPAVAQDVTIYGLDADLILLSMLLETETGGHVRLLREAQEFERGSALDEWRTLDIGGLMTAMFHSGKGSKAHVQDFVAAMSLLGNDFLPRSLTHSVHNDGIQELLGLLNKHVWNHGLQLVTDKGRISRPALHALVGVWAATEEKDMLVAVQTAVRESRREPRSGRESNPALDAWNALPASWAALALLSGTRNRDGSPMTLRPDWATVYRRLWRPGTPSDYSAGVAWVWDYYSGRAVDQGWAFDSHLPPLWADVAAGLDITSDTVHPPPIVYSTPLHDQVHLLAVLPAPSVLRLLPPAPFHGWMAATTPFWPTAWSLFDIGRTQMWECEAVLPLLPEAILRKWDAELRRPPHPSPSPSPSTPALKPKKGKKPVHKT